MALSGDIFVCHKEGGRRGGPTDFQQVEASDPGTHCAMPRAAAAAKKGQPQIRIVLMSGSLGSVNPLLQVKTPRKINLLLLILLALRYYSVIKTLYLCKEAALRSLLTHISTSLSFHPVKLNLL